MIDMIAVEKAYNKQIGRCKRKVDALGNPVEMRMTLAEFADEWIQSGKWHLRGIKKGEYCMARHNDIGHYEKGNVRIVTNSENISEAQKGRPKSAETKAKMIAANKGIPKSAESNNKRSATMKGRPAHNKGKPSPLKGKTISEEHKAKLSKPKIKTQCVHCGRLADPGMMKRWHGDNCKKAPV